MQTHASSPDSNSVVAERLKALRHKMQLMQLDAVVVRSTDTYLNEYVPLDESTRAYISGFRGSMGDCVITRDRAILVVDGRYTLQASQEAPDFESRTVTLGQSIELGILAVLDELKQQGVTKVGLETDRMSQSLVDLFDASLKKSGLAWQSTAPSLIERIRIERQELPAKHKGKVWAVEASLTGRTVKERVELGKKLLHDKQLHGILVVALDELAWITNLRGTHFPYQATFRSTGIVTDNAVLLQWSDAKTPVCEGDVHFAGPTVKDLIDVMKKNILGEVRLGYDARNTPAFIVASLKALNITLVDVESPFAAARVKKTKAELDHMVSAFARADAVVSRVKSWLCTSVMKGEKITEAMVAEKTEALFKRSGAFGLSFQVISAAGKNGAVIHYSHPNDTDAIKEGDLFLLDTGAYYEGGLATDLTRTFLVGGPKTEASAEQKFLFTKVLQGAIAGMCARLPVGATGEQLDALVRQPLWNAGLDYGHGTGHGVGVNVHESPPRITIGSRFVVEPGHVFSIEPGVYLPGFGGVRIENLCTVVVDEEPVRNGVPKKFMRVVPLTFSPLDKRLIDLKMLSTQERNFLKWFSDDKRQALPPLL